MGCLKILLTGGSTGIGKEVVRRTLDRSFDIYVIGLHKPDLLSDRNFVACDLGRSEQVEKILSEEKIPFDEIDVLINNAGVAILADTMELSTQAWHAALATNLNAAFLLTAKVLPGMYRRNSGLVITISSDADSRGFANGAAYAASKFGLRGFMESLQCEAKGTNVKACLISPGRVDTNFNGKKPGDRPRSLRPGDVADAIDYVLGTSPRCVPSLIRLSSTLE